MRGFRVPLLAAGTMLVLTLPAWAFAQGAYPSAPSAADASTVSTQTYDLSFTLPTAAKSGCMVCHGDPNIVRIENGVAVSMWIDSTIIEGSAHATIQCTGCHLDFAYTTPHDTAVQGDWRSVAKLACKNCHQDSFTAYSRGVHTLSPTPGQTATETPPPAEDLPLCGDCHGGHDIKTLKENPAAQAALHEQGWQVCGRCHEDYWDNYDDYYHGAAYKRGAPDAPACWDCHLAHDILPSSDRRSSVNEVNLVETCGQCHVHKPNDAYLSYSSLIHNTEAIREENPVYAFFRNAMETIRSWFD